MGLNYSMYFIEFIIKKIIKSREKTISNPNLDSEILDYESCEHVFMPIDSTSETLSCTKCGVIVQRRDLKNKNFFVTD